MLILGGFQDFRDFGPGLVANEGFRAGFAYGAVADVVVAIDAASQFFFESFKCRTLTRSMPMVDSSCLRNSSYFLPRKS